jgi:membrane protease YdiL (CAAX protease family)
MTNAADLQDNGYTARAGTPKEQLIEVLVFLFLIVPSMVLSFFVTRQGKVSFTFVAVSTILRDLALLSLVFFFAWHNGEPPAVLGWRYTRLDREIILGLVLYAPFFFLVALIERGLMQIGFSEPRTPSPSFFQFRGQVDLVLAVILVIIVAISEETIFRGYLYLRLRTVTRSPLAALLLASGIFALGHGYEGSLGLVTVGIMGLVFNLIYLWRKSLVAPMVMHFLQDFIGIVLVHFTTK